MAYELGRGEGLDKEPQRVHVGCFWELLRSKYFQDDLTLGHISVSNATCLLHTTLLRYMSFDYDPFVPASKIRKVVSYSIRTKPSLRKGNVEKCRKSRRLAYIRSNLLHLLWTDKCKKEMWFWRLIESGVECCEELKEWGNKSM